MLKLVEQANNEGKNGLHGGHLCGRLVGDIFKGCPKRTSTYAGLQTAEAPGNRWVPGVKQTDPGPMEQSDGGEGDRG